MPKRHLEFRVGCYREVLRIVGNAECTSDYTSYRCEAAGTYDLFITWFVREHAMGTTVECFTYS